MRPWLYKFDSSIITAVQAWPQWFYLPMLFITNVGQPIVMIIAALPFSVMALSRENAWLLIASGVVPLTIGLTMILKSLLQRARPKTEYVQNMLVTSFSFPSGHAAGAMIGCGFLAYIAWHALADPLGFIISGLLLFMIIAVGVSRVYLGAHYPSDVIGGWLVGAVGVSVIVLVIRPTF